MCSRTQKILISAFFIAFLSSKRASLRPDTPLIQTFRSDSTILPYTEGEAGFWGAVGT